MDLRHGSLAAFCLGAIYFACSLAGYGNDYDTYAMVRSGQNLLNGLGYSPSRAPGYPIPEIVIGATSKIGGSTFSNAISVALALGSLSLFYLLASRLVEPDRAGFAVLFVALNPVFVVAASSTMDYVYSIFFILAAVHALASDRFTLAALLSGLALGSRLSNALIVLVLYLAVIMFHYLDGNRRQALRVFASGILGVLVTAILFVPVFIASGHTLGFLTYAIGDWTFIENVARFLYKNLYLFGVAFFVGLALVLGLGEARALYTVNRDRFGLLLIGLALVLQGLFAKAPLEIEYLIPFIFIVGLALARALKATARILLLGLVASYSFININLLDIEYDMSKAQAVGAKFRVSLGKGYLTEDLYRRSATEKRYRDYLRD